jgi:hypothetical protein
VAFDFCLKNVSFLLAESEKRMAVGATDKTKKANPFEICFPFLFDQIINIRLR